MLKYKELESFATKNFGATDRYYEGYGFDRHQHTAFMAHKYPYPLDIYASLYALMKKTARQ